jgi:hypothetical protein
MDFGDGTTSKDINPIKNMCGTYKVVLEIRNSAGASDTYGYDSNRIIAPPDVVAPVITLIGNPTINVVIY